MLQEYFFQILLALVGVLAGIVSALLPKQYLRILLAIVGILVVSAASVWGGYLLGLGEVSPETQPISPTAPIAIDATKGWQSTGITLQKGDTVTVTVVGGAWTGLREPLPEDERNTLLEAGYEIPEEIWMHVWEENEGEGFIDWICEESDCPDPNFPVAALVARIGSDSVEGIGRKHTFIAPESGMLYMRINDGSNEGTRGLRDNAGVLAVEVNVER